MRKFRNIARGIRALSLVAILNGCATNDENVKKENSNVAQNDVSFEVVPFSMYNPLIDSEFVKPKIEYIENCVAYSTFCPQFSNGQLQKQRATSHAVIHSTETANSIEINLEDFNKIHIKDYLCFKNDIYRVAGEIGYKSEEVNGLSPRETVELVCKIVAHRVNYFGISQDYATKSKRKETLDKIKSNLDYLINSSDASESQKSSAENKINDLSELERRWDAIDIYERMLSLESGQIVTSADELSADELFKGKEPVVCRHYSTISEAIFFVLKNENSNLKNTWVSGYSDRNHRWNKITTLTKSGKSKKYTISFFDPTWYDLSSEIEGYDSSHFPDTNMLESQISSLSGEKIINPPLKKH